MKKSILLFSAILFLGIGLIGAINIILHGEHAMGTTNEVPFGALIAGYEYFVGISTGVLLIVALGYIFNLKAIIFYGKSLLALSIAAMFSAFAILLVELGNPLNFIYYFISANINSPIWWMAPLYGLYLLLLILLFYFVLINNEQMIKRFSILTAISALIALISIGFLFGFLTARPYWQGPLTPLYFIVTAFYSGISVTAILFGADKTNEGGGQYSFIRNLMLGTIGITFVIYLGKIFTGLYGFVPGKYEAVQALLSGPLSFNFWTFEVLLAFVIPIVLLAWKKQVSHVLMTLAGLSAVIGQFFMRVDMVFAGQVSPLKIIYGSLKETSYNSFAISWSEWALIMGGFGIMLFFYSIKDWIYKQLDKFMERSIKKAM